MRLAATPLWVLISFFLLCSPIAAQAGRAGPFLRGDANGDDNVNVSDMIFILRFLFTDGPPPVCGDAADVNDDGALNLSDSVFGLAWLVAEWAWVGERLALVPVEPCE